MKLGILSVMFVGLLGSTAMAQSVTVGTSGAQYTSLNDAIIAVGDDAAEPDVITILDAGPFFESRVIVNSGSSDDEDLTIQASPGVRPKIVVKSSADGAFYLRKSGNLIVRDLIIMPTVDFAPGEYEANVAQAAIQIDDDAGIPTSVTLQNILVTSNDGNNNPVASLDGLTSPTFTDNTVSFRDEGIQAASAATDATRNVYMYDVIISGIAGDQGSDGIRGFIDGAPGSEWIVGPGCVVSYNNHNEEITSQTTRAAFQPGGTNGMNVKVQGTQEKPVKFINNNLNGISLTNTGAITDGLTDVEWCIIANNNGAGLTSVDINGPLNLTNVTFANNHDGLLHAPPEADEKIYNFSNVIAAGNGGASDPANVFEFLADGASPGIFASTFTATDSAIVLNGPYTLNNVDYGADGIVSAGPWVIAKVNVIDADPEFLSLDPTNGAFAVVSNSAYGTAGPGGSALVGGGKFATSSVKDWQLF